MFTEANKEREEDERQKTLLEANQLTDHHTFYLI
jgi:hypothetical protein